MCVRTTIDLPDALAEAAKAKAAAEGRTFTSVVEEALREVVSDDHDTQLDIVLPAFGDRQGHPLVDLLDRDQVWAALDADGPH